jgi:predicted kinase
MTMLSRLILVRGLPGSGKSTLAKTIRRTHVHLEADMYFMNDKTGEYEFDASMLSEAHSWCQLMCQLHLTEGRSVVVSNTFSRRWEIEPYFKIAAEMNVIPFVITCESQFGSVHVGDDVVQKMRDRWEDLK